MTLIAILAATLVAGIGSVWLAAALLALGVRRHSTGVNPQHLLSLAAGALMATAFMHLLPEAFESGIEPHVLFPVLLGGLVLFFLLDKAELWHHGHEHGEHGEDGHAADDAVAPLLDGAVAGDAPALPSTQDPSGPWAHAHRHSHPHAHGEARTERARSGGWAVLTGDGVHCFGDGVLIASAFVADLRLGLVAALAVLAHEVPHHIGDLVVLRQSSANPRAALLKVSLAGTMTGAGGLIGWWLVDHLQSALPYLLVLASSSFVYVALADLIPQLQKRLSARQTVAQVLWLAGGIALVTATGRLAHGGH